MASVLVVLTLDRAHFLIENCWGSDRSPSSPCVVGPSKEALHKFNKINGRYKVRCKGWNVLQHVPKPVRNFSVEG